MRIIAGKFKGRILKVPADRAVRPATDRVKGSIFNTLQNRISLADSVILDLFAGSGSLGFESISRGAKRVVFIDSNPNTIDTILLNAKILNCQNKCEVHKMDALKCIGQLIEQFDLIFADPPYNYNLLEKLPKMIFRRKILKNHGYLIIEHSKRTHFDSTELYELASQRQFGNTLVSYFIYPPQLET